MATFFWDHLAAIRDSVRCTDTPTPPITPLEYAQALGLFFYGDLQYPILFGHTLSF